MTGARRTGAGAGAVSGAGAVIGTASYLCRRPEEERQVAVEQRRLEELADRLGLPRPVLFLDRPGSGAGPGAALARLLAAADAGAVQLVLVPGLWVFGPGEEEAERRRTMLTARGAHVLAAAAGIEEPPLGGRPGAAANGGPV
ncbi:hypothetical protein ACWDRR_40970 [Kitasatospora sp. NPDC003701]